MLSLRSVAPLLFVSLICFHPAAAGAQTTPTVDEITFARTFLLADVSGTAANPGGTPHHAHLFTRGSWTLFDEGTIFAADVTQSGPATHESALFSTNWFAAGAQHEIGRRGLLLFRGRISLEPLTVSHDGYPMLLQSVPGKAVDRQPGHDLIGELAANLAWRIGTTSFVHLYLAPVGDPAFGAVPFPQRTSSEEIVEAPFSFNPQEMSHRETGVATAGFATRLARIEVSSFHAAHSGRSDSNIFGAADSWSGRVTVTPARNWSAQLSSGRFGRGAREQSESGSISYGRDSGSGAFATSLIWSRAKPFSSIAAEATLRASRNILVLRLESVDRDPSLFVTQAGSGIRKMAHGTIGYTRDVITANGYRAGVGADIDYHSDVHDLKSRYGHKPQSIFLFVRLRTDAKDERGR